MALDPFDTSSSELIADPYPIYAEYRAHDPVHYSEAKRSWFVFSHELVCEAFRDPALSTDRAKADKHRGRPSPVRQIDQDGPNHKVIRSTLNSALHPMVSGFAERVEEIVASMSDELERSVDRFLDQADGSQGEVDFIERFAYPLPITVIADLMAIPEADRDRFKSWSHTLARAMDRFFTKGAMSPFKEMRGYFTELVAERTANPGDDLISRLLAVDEFGEDRLTGVEAAQLAVGLIFAGHETTVNLLANGLHALLSDDAERRRFLSDPHGLAASAVEEFLRFDSPGQIIARAVVEPTELGGKELEPGAALVVVLGSANRDEAVFGDTAASLDIGRTPNLHIAFGVGRHFCPGSRLARLEGRIAFPRILERFPDLRLGTTLPTRRPTAMFRGLETLPVTLT